MSPCSPNLDALFWAPWAHWNSVVVTVACMALWRWSCSNEFLWRSLSKLVEAFRIMVCYCDRSLSAPFSSLSQEFFNIVIEPFLWRYWFLCPIVRSPLWGHHCEVTIKQMTRYAVIVYSNNMPHPAKLSVKQHSLDAGGAGALQDFQIGDTVLPENS